MNVEKDGVFKVVDKSTNQIRSNFHYLFSKSNNALLPMHPND